MTVAAALAAAYVPGVSNSFSLSAALSTSTLSGTGTTSTITTGASVTVTPSGGTPPYTYAWAPDDNPDNIQASTPSAATTSFRKTSCISGDVYQSAYFCVVGDALGAHAETADVFITITRT